MSVTGTPSVAGSAAIATTWRATTEANIPHQDVTILPDRTNNYEPQQRMEFYIPPIHSWVTDIRLTFRLFVPGIVYSANRTFSDFEPAGGIGGFAIIKQIVLMDGNGRQIEVMTQPNIFLTNRGLIKFTPGQMNMAKTICGFDNQDWQYSNGDKQGWYVELPLRWILGTLDSPNALPCGFVNGLRIHIYLEDGPRALRVTRWSMMNVRVETANFDDNDGGVTAVENSMLSFYINNRNIPVPIQAGKASDAVAPVVVDTQWADIGVNPEDTDDIVVFSTALMTSGQFYNPIFTTAQDFTDLIKYGWMINDTQGVANPLGVGWSYNVALASVDTLTPPSTYLGRIDPQLIHLCDEQNALWFIRIPQTAEYRPSDYVVYYPQLIVRTILIPAQFMTQLGQEAIAGGLQQWVHVYINQQTPTSQGTELLVTYNIRSSDQWVTSIYAIPTVMGIQLNVGTPPNYDAWLLDPLIAVELDHYLEYYLKVKGEPVPVQPVPMLANNDTAQYYWEISSAFRADGEEAVNLSHLKRGYGGCIARALGNRGYAFDASKAEPFQFVITKNAQTTNGELWNTWWTKAQLNKWKAGGIEVLDSNMRAGTAF